MSKKKKKRKASEKENVELNLTQKIESGSQGLYYISETDAAILPFVGTKADSVSAAELLRQTENKIGSQVEERSFDEIFQRLTTIKDWFGEEEKRTAERFAELRDLLQNNLKDLKVFKIGRVQIDIYFVGLDADGNLTGIKTKAVET